MLASARSQHASFNGVLPREAMCLRAALALFHMDKRSHRVTAAVGPAKREAGRGQNRNKASTLSTLLEKEILWF